MRRLAVALAIQLFLCSWAAEAHFVLVSPPMTTPQPAAGAPANDAQSGKGAPPCGSDPVSTTLTPAQGGHPLHIMVTETVRHGGFYRVALALKARTELPVDNVVFDAANKVLPPSGNPSGLSDHATIQMPAVFPVLADGLFPHAQLGAGGPQYAGDVMLPNVSCDHCTLQVIEFMTPHGFNTGGGYFYHHCADLKITADPALPPYMPGADGGAADAPAADAPAMDHPAMDMVAGSGGAAGTDASQPGSGGASGSGGMTQPGTGGSSTDAGMATGGKSGGGGGSSGGCVVAGQAPGQGCLIILALVVGCALFRRRRRG